MASPRRAAEALEKAGDLRTYDAGLRANSDIRIIVNQNDFLLTDEDLAWAPHHVCPGTINGLRARRSLGKSFQSGGAKVHFGSADAYGATPTQI
jgi:hypothetical protein